MNTTRSLSRRLLLLAASCGVLWTAACSREPKTIQIPPTGLTDKEAAELAEEASESAVEPDGEGFLPLRLRNFDQFAAEPGTWTEANGLITTTGKPKGYIYSKHPYKNFTWRAEFRFLPESDPAKADQSNTGFMVCIHEPHKVWPRSLEVQGKYVEMGQIKSNGGVPALTIKDDEAARNAARKPVGEWNAIEITVRDGAVSSVLNGQPICTSEAGEVREGMIGLQAENFAVQFRNLRIKE